MPRMCQTLTCPVCVRQIAYRYGAAIALARPQQMSRLSLVGGSWEETHRRVNRVFELIRKGGRAIKVAWHVEANPRGTGAHVHCWSHGDPLTERDLRRCAVRAGMGHEVHVQRAYVPAGHPPQLIYGMKAVLEGPLDPTRLSPTAELFLDLNGRRLVHQSRGFYRDHRGGPIGVRQAAALAFAGARTHRWDS